ncbi:dihydroxy-acid dehydratase [Aeromicrobium sp. UC242_57]|uniref:dihydroxy-acid dehydratase domain-containing protein n=1 Tax=Aeromicrobium sp. UC242_57 TaxID=3374624 RepID=UPI00379324CD
MTGKTLADQLDQMDPLEDWQHAIKPLSDPLGSPGALAVVRGTLAPNGAVIKTSAADPRLMQHTGPAFVVDAGENIAAILDDPDLDVTPDHVLVLRFAGPIAAGMPEAGALPIPAKLARQGVRDMVRVSDARMSGTSYGTVVLHCDPEAAAGGPSAIVQNGDMITLDVEGRRLDLLISEDEIADRLSRLETPALPERGWRRLYAETVMPASQGADLSFL